MRLLNDIERVALPVDGRGIEALVRVRGIDARRDGRGAVVRLQDPVAIEAGGRRFDIPAPELGPPGWLFAAIPLACLFVRALAARATKGGR
jgi:hypothetical protein